MTWETPRRSSHLQISTFLVVRHMFEMQFSKGIREFCWLSHHVWFLKSLQTRSTLNNTSNAVGWVGFPIHGHFLDHSRSSPRDFPGRSSSLPLKPPAIRWIRWMRHRRPDIVGWKQQVQVLETGGWCDNWLVNSDKSRLKRPPSGCDWGGQRLESGGPCSVLAGAR